MAKYNMNDLTELEQQWVKAVFDDGTGWLDNSCVAMDRKVERGVISGLIKKGIIYTDDYNEYTNDMDLCASSEYEEWFC